MTLRLSAFPAFLLAAGLMLGAAGAARAQGDDDLPVPPKAMIGMVYFPEDGVEGLERFLRETYPENWDPLADDDKSLHIGRKHIRWGRYDLNGDGSPEVVLMVVHPGWGTPAGYPYIVLQARGREWRSVGYGWSDEDRLLVLPEKLGGWYSLDAPDYVMHWVGREYQTEAKADSPYFGATEPPERGQSSKPAYFGQETRPGRATAQPKPAPQPAPAKKKK